MQTLICLFSFGGLYTHVCKKKKQVRMSYDEEDFPYVPQAVRF